MSKITITRTSPTIGAEIHGVDLRTASDADFEEIKRAYLAHGVIFIRDQALAPEDHIEFAQRWGDININRFFTPVKGYPQIAEVLKEPDQQQNIGGGWHTDHSYDSIPAMGSILYALEVPEVGGDTLFASMGAAYDALSDGYKDMLETLYAEHSSRHVFGNDASAYAVSDPRIGNPDMATQDALHPVVIAHPNTGRKLLYVNPGFTLKINGWNQEESDNLLSYLYRHASQPAFTTRFNWQTGSLAMWDNRSTWHYALNDYQGNRRYMHRITLSGEPLTAAAQA